MYLLEPETFQLTQERQDAPPNTGCLLPINGEKWPLVIDEPVELEKHGSNPRLQGRLPIYVVHMMIVPQPLNPKPRPSYCSSYCYIWWLYMEFEAYSTVTAWVVQQGANQLRHTAVNTWLLQWVNSILVLSFPFLSFSRLFFETYSISWRVSWFPLCHAFKCPIFIYPVMFHY